MLATWWKCDVCAFVTDKLAVAREYHGSKEQKAEEVAIFSCPSCTAGELCGAEQCGICGEVVKREDLYCGVCRECLKMELYDPETVALYISDTGSENDFYAKWAYGVRRADVATVEYLGERFWHAYALDYRSKHAVITEYFEEHDEWEGFAQWLKNR